jgi:cytochrome P450
MAESLLEQLPEVLGGFDLTDHASFAASPEGFPYALFARLREHEPVLYHPPCQTADGEGFWVLTRHADIAAAATDPETFSARGGGGRAAGGSHLDDMPFGVLAGVILPMMDNPRHHLLKHLLTPAVTGQALRELEPELRRHAAALVDAALERGACDFASDIAEPYAYESMAILLGIAPQERAEVAGWAHVSTGLINRRTGLPDDESRRTWQATVLFAKHLMAVKRARPAHDLGTALATGQLPPDAGEAPLTDHERETNALLLLLTGAEQPRNTIAGGVAGLAAHPRQWEALRADRSLVPGAVEEMLRWAPPNPYNRRTATRDVRLGGVEIAAGEKVTLWWPSANRDETAFPDPGRFDVRRSPNPHMTFGYGNHYCLGNEVARLQIRVLLEALLDRVAAPRPAGPISYQPSNKHTIVLDMPVELDPAAG